MWYRNVTVCLNYWYRGYTIQNLLPLVQWSSDSLVSKMAVVIRFPIGRCNFSFHFHIQNCSGHVSDVNRCPFPGDKCTRSWPLTSNAAYGVCVCVCIFVSKPLWVVNPQTTLHFTGREVVINCNYFPLSLSVLFVPVSPATFLLFPFQFPFLLCFPTNICIFTSLGHFQGISSHAFHRLSLKSTLAYQSS